MSASSTSRSSRSARTLGGGTSALQWVVNAYTVAFAAFILTAGALGDRIGAKRVFVAGFALFTAASVACGLAPGLGVLIAARAVQGVGAAMLVPCSLSLLSHAYPDRGERARAVGLWAAGASVALSAGPLVGGLLTAAFGWRAIFFINLPLGLFAIGSRCATRRRPRARRSAASTCPAARGGRRPGARSPRRRSRAASAGFADPVGARRLRGRAAAGRGVRRDRALPARADAAAGAVPLARLQRPRPRSGWSINIAFYGLIFVLSLFFQRAQHLSAAADRARVRADDRRRDGANCSRAGSRPPRTGDGRRCAADGGRAGRRCSGSAPGTGYRAIVAQLVALGFGVGADRARHDRALLASVDQSRSGVASGTLNTARQTGSVIGVALFGSLASRPRGARGVGRARAGRRRLRSRVTIGQMKRALLSTIVASLWLAAPARAADPVVTANFTAGATSEATLSLKASAPDADWAEAGS